MPRRTPSPVPSGTAFVWEDPSGVAFDVEIQTDQSDSGYQDYRCRRTGSDRWLEGMAQAWRVQRWHAEREAD